MKVKWDVKVKAGHFTDGRKQNRSRARASALCMSACKITVLCLILLHLLRNGRDDKHKVCVGRLSTTT